MRFLNRLNRVFRVSANRREAVRPCAARAVVAVSAKTMPKGKRQMFCGNGALFVKKLDTEMDETLCVLSQPNKSTQKIALLIR